LSVCVQVDLYLPEGRSSVQALSTTTDFSNRHLYTEDHGLLLIVKFRNEHTISCVFTYHETHEDFWEKFIGHEECFILLYIFCLNHLPLW